jgi:hypothetical protein
VLGLGDIEAVRHKPPGTIRSVLQMVGPPAKIYRTPVFPGLTIWEYRAATGRVEFHHKDGRVTDIYLPTGS